MYDIGLADRIRAKGVRVIEVAGWKTRGDNTYDPDGAVHHHTAGSASGATPSLNTVIYGRPDLPGPLAQVFQSREADPTKDIAYVVAAGKANHAGSGGWNGLSGNYKVGGVEVEHVGTHTVNVARHEITSRILAALIEAPGSVRSAANVCQHFEWAPGRKIDFFDLSPWSANIIRQRVAYWVGRSASQEEDMPTPAEIADAVWGYNLTSLIGGASSPASGFLRYSNYFVYQIKVETAALQSIVDQLAAGAAVIDYAAVQAAAAQAVKDVLHSV